MEQTSGADGGDRLARNDDHDRYELIRDGEVLAVLYYGDETAEDGSAVRDMRSTIVSPDHSGQGLGSTLVRFALDDTRDAGMRIIPTCWFVRGLVERHPEYAEMMTGEDPPA